MKVETEESTGLESKGFNAHLESLTPESEDNSLVVDLDNESASLLGDSDDPVLPDDIVDEEASIEGEEGESVASEDVTDSDDLTEEEEEILKKFVGDMSEEEVLEKLSRIDGMEAQVAETVAAKVFGKFGEVGQQIKALQESGFKIDPTKLSRLKGIDEEMAAALGEDLMEVFSSNQIDTETIQKNAIDATMEGVRPMIEQRVFDALTPDAGELVEDPEYRDWYHKVASQNIKNVFTSWDDGSDMNGAKLANAFSQFRDFRDEKVKAKTMKKANLAKAVVDTKKTSKSKSTTRRNMTEDEAFAARLNE